MNQMKTNSLNELSSYFDIYNKIDLTFLDTDVNKIQYYLYKYKDHNYNSFCTLQEYVNTVSDENINDITAIIGYPFTSTVELERNTLQKCNTVEFWIESSRVYRDTKKLYKVIRSVVLKSHAFGVKTRVVTELKKLNNDIIKDFLSICQEAKVDSIQTGYGLTYLDRDWIPELADKVGNIFEIKAVGGINSIEEAERIIKMGADLIGSSTI